MKKKMQKKKDEEVLFVTGSGDDGSPVCDEEGNFIGMVIATSGSGILVTKAKNIEKYV